MTNVLRRVISEPLTHFLLIGVALFAADLALRPEAIDPRTIRVDAKVHAELAAIFEESRERLPTPDEMDELVEIHLRNEVLVREARELRLDDGDQMMRERLAQRMRLLIYNGIEVPNPGDETLRDYFAENTAKYVTPGTLSFDVIGLDGDEQEVRDLAARAAEQDPDLFNVPGTPRTRLEKRPRDQMIEILGDAFIARVEAAPMGSWTAIPSPRGWQLVRFRAKTEAVTPAFEEVRNALWGDWRNETTQREAREALASLMASYPVERAAYGPDVVAEPAISAETAQSSDNSAKTSTSATPVQ